MKSAKPEEISVSFKERLRETGALLEGHFQLSSGLHAPRYFQCARFLQHPAQAEWACRELAKNIEEPVDVVLGPALGGMIAAYELGRALGVRALFTERLGENMTLRRGFEIARGERVLVVEDVVTTGLSAREAAECVRAAGGEIAAFASLIDRSGGKVAFGVPFYALLTVEEEALGPECCPLCTLGITLDKPGSRKVSMK
ncbi:MAG TPA: orotate phosphoribosyltransferase [Cyanobacteria bacterium UBA8530]|nr:orotate phosphoribosyltransferase [Cyanobacteria bacterium UBA8530]